MTSLLIAYGWLVVIALAAGVCTKVYLKVTLKALEARVKALEEKS